MRRFDVIVVGAGPAGCAVAYDLASAALSVLLVDCKPFPRIKPCAGMLTIKAINRLRYSIAPVIRFVVRDLDVHLNRQWNWILPSAAPIAVLTVRQELDAFCLKQTLDKGVLFEIVEDLVDLAEDADGVTLTTDKQKLRSSYLVGADGVSSRIRQMLGEHRTPRALALEGKLTNSALPPVSRFDFRYVEGGYGWVFPKGDHLNIGIYTQRAGIALSKVDLRNYAKFVADVDHVEEIIGYPVGVGGEHCPVLRRRIFLVGDALGVTERLLGEGIHNAIKTGQAAAAAICSDILEKKAALPVFKKMLRQVQSDLMSSRTAAKWFYDMPALQFAELAQHRRWISLMRGYAAGMTFRNIMRTFFLSRFYRIAPVRCIVELEERHAHTHAVTQPRV